MSLSQTEARKEAIKKLWHLGHLQWKLHDVQKKDDRVLFNEQSGSNGDFL